MNKPIAITGVAIHAPRNNNARSLEESIYAVVQAALRDANTSIGDIEGIVVAGNDQLDGRAISIMAASGSVGGVDRDILSTPSAAEHAFVLGALRIASGQFKTQLAVAWSPLEVDSVSYALTLANDPYFHRALAQDELSAHGLQACALEGAVPGLREAAIAVVSKNRMHGAQAYPDHRIGPVEEAFIGAGNPLRWPLTDTMVCPPDFGLVAMVMCDAKTLPRACHPAWIRGMGWATEPGFLGDRDLAHLPSLQAASKQAYRTAGISDPAHFFDLAEVADATPYQEFLSYEGLGLCSREMWVEHVAKRRSSRGASLPVNLSGGAQCFNPVFCAGLVRIAEAANQVRGRAGAHQIAPARRAVAHAASGPAMHYNTVVVLENSAQEVRS
ncbi:MAG: thiolase C-terminal domain-containing protein [Burkholderiales bacterium]